MNGPEHYREAEALIERAAEWMDANMGKADLAEAQVHATLALAAATATAQLGGRTIEEMNSAPVLAEWVTALAPGRGGK